MYAIRSYYDARLFNDRVGDFRFSFDYYYAHIMRPFNQHSPAHISYKFV